MNSQKTSACAGKHAGVRGAGAAALALLVGVGTWAWAQGPSVGQGAQGAVLARAQLVERLKAAPLPSPAIPIDAALPDLLGGNTWPELLWLVTPSLAATDPQILEPSSTDKLIWSIEDELLVIAGHHTAVFGDELRLDPVVHGKCRWIKGGQAQAKPFSRKAPAPDEGELVSRSTVMTPGPGWAAVSARYLDGTLAKVEAAKCFVSSGTGIVPGKFNAERLRLTARNYHNGKLTRIERLDVTLTK